VGGVVAGAGIFVGIFHSALAVLLERFADHLLGIVEVHVKIGPDVAQVVIGAGIVGVVGQDVFEMIGRLVDLIDIDVGIAGHHVHFFDEFVLDFLLFAKPFVFFHAFENVLPGLGGLIGLAGAAFGEGLEINYHPIVGQRFGQAIGQLDDLAGFVLFGFVVDHLAEFKNVSQPAAEAGLLLILGEERLEQVGRLVELIQ